MLKEFNSWEELLDTVNKDIYTIYHTCMSLHLITSSVDDVSRYVHDFTTEMYKECPCVNLFTVKNRYMIVLMCIGTSLDGIIWKRDAIIDYNDKFILVIRDMQTDECLSGHPFVDMNLDDIINYLWKDKVLKSDNFKYKYDLFRDNRLVCSLCGMNNSVVMNYFKNAGGRNIKVQRVSSNESLYCMKKDNEEFKFIIKRSTL